MRTIQGPVRQVGGLRISGRPDLARRETRPYILMLVPHEPEDDPRIRWVTELCTSVARTEILGATWSTEKEAREYDGLCYKERVNINEHASGSAKRVARVLGRLHDARTSRRCPAQEAREGTEEIGIRGVWRSWLRAVAAAGEHQTEAALRFVEAWGFNAMMMSALHRRARSVSLIPRLLICHDLYGLMPAIRLKQRYGCPVIYDSHEFWPQANLDGPPWESRILARVEGAFARRADIVVTVSPHLARHLQTLYRLNRVLSVPNAEPFIRAGSPSCERQVRWPVRFLLQGRIVPGRGIDTFLRAWSRLNDRRAVLYLRCPESPYLTELQAQYRSLIEQERIVILEAGASTKLVELASFADVGVIPYVGPNLNHVYACPNKLSQYMQAGLAILSSRLDFITEVVGRYECGIIYDADRPDSLVAGVKQLVDDLDRLQVMKRNAYRAAESEFNWQIQSQPYRRAIHELFDRSAGT